MIEKGRVYLAALGAIARVGRKQLAGDLLGDLEGEPEARRRLREEPLPERLAGELVEGEVATHGGEDFGVLAQTIGLEDALREPAASEVSRARIDLVDPAFVLPGAAADVDAAARELPERFLEVAAERFRLGKIEKTAGYHAWAVRYP